MLAAVASINLPDEPMQKNNLRKAMTRITIGRPEVMANIYFFAILGN